MKAKAYKRNNGSPTPKPADREVGPIRRALAPIGEGIATFIEFLFSERSLYFRFGFCFAGLVISYIWTYHKGSVIWLFVFFALTAAQFPMKWVNSFGDWLDNFSERHPTAWAMIGKLTDFAEWLRGSFLLVMSLGTLVASFYFWPHLWAIAVSIVTFFHLLVAIPLRIDNANRNKKAQIEAAKLKEATPPEPLAAEQPPHSP